VRRAATSGGITRPNDRDGDGIAVTDMGAYEYGKVF
jgi:hypothetical protein